MVAIEHEASRLAHDFWNPRSRTLGFAAGVALAVVIAWSGFLANGGDFGAARAATTLVMLTSSFVFILFYVSQPLARLIRSDVTRTLRQERFALAYGFGGMMAVFITCTLTPDYMSGARIPLPTMAFAGLTALVCAVFLLSAGSKRADRSVTLRSLRSISSGYFWLMFAFSNLDHMVGPHRPDNNPYGLSLLLLVVALLICFADAFMTRIRAGMPERPV